MAERWTPETEELVALRGAGANAARDILGALAEAGLLLPPGCTQREQWRVEVDRGDGDGYTAGPFIADSVDAIAFYRRGIVKPKRTMRRVVLTGPWVEVPDA